MVASGSDAWGYGYMVGGVTSRPVLSTVGGNNFDSTRLSVPIDAGILWGAFAGGA